MTLETAQTNEWKGAVYFDMTAKDAAGAEVGKISYIERGTLEVEGLDVATAYQGQGVSARLFAEVVEANPGITSIKGQEL